MDSDRSSEGDDDGVKITPLPDCKKGDKSKIVGVDCKKVSDKQEGLAQLPTCDQWITTNCQPVCTRDQTTGCTEAASPEPPKRDRFEGKYTHKPGQTTIQPRILPRDGTTNNYHH